MTKQRLLSQSCRQLLGGSGSFNADSPLREILPEPSPEGRVRWAEATWLHLLSLGCKGDSLCLRQAASSRRSGALPWCGTLEALSLASRGGCGVLWAPCRERCPDK